MNSKTILLVEDNPRDIGLTRRAMLKSRAANELEVLRQTRSARRTQRLPVVMLTSSLEEQDIDDCCDLGVNSCICKPVDFGQFAVAIQPLDLYWRVLNQTPPQTRK
jgi:two-component system response regulator